jgi:hypothetical protein
MYQYELSLSVRQQDRTETENGAPDDEHGWTLVSGGSGRISDTTVHGYGHHDDADAEVCPLTRICIRPLLFHVILFLFACSFMWTRVQQTGSVDRETPCA